MGRPKIVDQFGEYLAVCRERGIPVSEAHIEGGKFVLKFTDKDEPAGQAQPIDLIQWGKP